MTLSASPIGWAKRYNIWVFIVTPGPICAVRSTQLNEDIRLEVQFRQATGANITVIMVSEEPGTLEIDMFKHALVTTSHPM